MTKRTTIANFRKLKTTVCLPGDEDIKSKIIILVKYNQANI